MASALASQGIKRGAPFGAVPLLDLAPTCLALLGQPIPQTLMGKVNPAILPG